MTDNDLFITLFIQERYGSRGYRVAYDTPLYWQLFNIGEELDEQEESER